MSDDCSFDWAALAPLAEIEALVERVCMARGLSGIWYASEPEGIPVRGGRITDPSEATLAVLTLEGYQPDQTQLRLQAGTRAAARSPEVAALADALYQELVRAGWLPTDDPLLPATPRFVRPRGFRPRNASHEV